MRIAVAGQLVIFSAVVLCLPRPRRDSESCGVWPPQSPKQ